MLQRIIRHLQHPPPWRWLCQDLFWQRVGPAPLWQLPLELFQQLHWWLVIPLRRGLRWKRLKVPIPLGLRLRACWLNSYQPRELAWWWAAGVCDWEDLSSKASESLARSLHRQRRQLWPEQCQPALKILRDKAALLELTPAHWRPAFLTLQPNIRTKATPNWWRNSLHQDGLVLKPLRGHAGYDVVRFRWDEQGLKQEGLFRQLAQTGPSWPSQQHAEPEVLYRHWQRITGSCEPALAIPYLRQSSLLPKTNPSMVVRVVTAQVAPDQTIGVIHAWLEVPLSGGLVSFLSKDGLLLPKPGKPLSKRQAQDLQQWKELLGTGKKTAIQACLDAAITMHALLPPIDRVAWDWIPAEPEPLLLRATEVWPFSTPTLSTPATIF